MSHIPIRYPISHIDNPIDVPLMSDLPYQCPISISHIDTGSYLVTLYTSGRQVGSAPPVMICAAATAQAPVSPRSLSQRWHVTAWRPPQWALWAVQCAFWHWGLQ